MQVRRFHNSPPRVVASISPLSTHCRHTISTANTISVVQAAMIGGSAENAAIPMNPAVTTGISPNSQLNDANANKMIGAAVIMPSASINQIINPLLSRCAKG